MHEVDLFEHAASISSARGDNFLKWISPDYYTADTGNVEAPTGFVALVQVTPDIIAQYVSEEGDPWMSERRNFAPGWFLIKIDNQGIVWGHEYGGWCDMHEAFCADSFEEMKVRHDFDIIEKAYAEWDAEVNGDPEPEKMYLVCNHDCGEAFDDIALAAQHRDSAHADDPSEIGWLLLPESEAM